ncbi:MAG TPA: hypothetical protein VNM92_02775 [Thermoanaerobaculia bacterium]|nr:hypothetical protein [Thermoanaerobaculia bacterium]
MNTTEQRGSRRWLKVAATVVFVTVAIEIAAGFAIYHSFDQWSERGTFGDMFGPVTSLFSALALAAVAVSVVLQSEELALQRQEISENRRELQRTADAQVETVNLFREQLKATQQALEEERTRRRLASVPVFRFLGASAAGGSMDLRLANDGAQIRDLNILTRGPYGIAVPKPTDVLMTGYEFKVPIGFSGSPPEQVTFELSFTDSNAERRRVVVEVDTQRGSARTHEI